MVMNEIGKIVLLGDNTVGKSCLVKSFLSPEFDIPCKYSMTIAVEPSAKSIQCSSFDDPVKLLFLDCTGLELYHGMLTTYWDQPNMLLLVYDVTSQLSFENLSQWIELARGAKWRNKSVGPLAAAIFGNKTDLTEKRSVSYELGKEIADLYQMTYFEGSAKERQGINELFQWFADKWRDYCKE